MTISTRNLRGWAAVALALMVFAAKASAQENRADGNTLPPVGIKTNLLYDATGTFNLGVEFRTGRRTSLDLSGNWNPFTFSEGRKWKHVLVQPEFRWWTKETFNGHFFGLHAHYASYNIGRLPNGPFSEYMADHRFEGWAAGAGVSYGYRWNFSYNWGLEATIGVGYVHLDYDKYKCGNCGERLGAETKNYFGPTKAGITLIYSFGKKPKTTPSQRGYVPTVVPVRETVIYEPQFTAGFITPEVEAVKRRSEAGRAYLDFATGKSDIVPSFRNNAAELDKIHGLIEAVRDNPDATITGITIKGYASPEGSYQSNLTLSGRRAFALKSYIKNLYGFPETFFEVNGQGEDWTTLEELVSRSGMADKYAVLEIIRATAGTPDERERRLKQLSGGEPYRVMISELYPQLRRTDYELHYTVLPFSVEKGKEVLRTHPGNLSLNEMFLIANTYPSGSAEFNEVFEAAARVFPQDDVANLNAAASALGRKDAARAARYLERIKNRNAEYWNNAGILAYLEGDAARAADCFARAGQAAARNAAELDRHNQSKATPTPNR